MEYQDRPMRGLELRGGGHTKRLYTAVFSPDGRLVVTTSADTTARLWQWSTGKTLHVLRGHRERVLSAAFGKGSRKVITVSSDRTARVWDTATGNLRDVLKGHSGPVTDVQFSPWGKFVATASEDRTARLGEVKTGKVLAVMAGHTNYVTSVAFSGDGESVVTTSRDGTARVWRFPRDKDGKPIVRPYSRPFDALSTIARAQIEGRLTPGERDRYLQKVPWVVRIIKRLQP